VLEEIRVHTVLRHLHVRLNVVIEHLDVQIHAFFGQGRFDELEDLGVRHGRGRDGQGFVGLRGQGGDSGEYGQ